MVKDQVVECSFFIPIHPDRALSDRDEHSAEIWQWLQDELYRRFRGGTSAPGVYKGFYEDPNTGERVGDESHRFIVALRTSQVNQLRSLLSMACTLFAQKCVYLSIAGKVEFIRASGDEEN